MLKKEQQTLMNNGEALPIMEEFYTIQGEGFYTGAAAYFIRTGGCDVGCPWCDVKESWIAEEHEIMEVDTIIKNASVSKIAIITGGEPLMWNMNYITTQLKRHNIRRHIETSGAYEVSGEWDWFCLSPKKRKLPTESAYQAANELKIIILNDNDFKFAEAQAEKVNNDCLLYMQPEWDKGQRMIHKMTEYVKNNPKWRISLQTHKYLNIP